MAIRPDNTSAARVAAEVDIEHLARWQVDQWFVDGMDRDDLMQEARLAAWLSTLTWTPAGGMSATNWARMHVQSRMKDLVTRSHRLKSVANVDALRLDAPTGGGEGLSLGELIPDGQASVHDQAVKREEPTARETIHALAERANLTTLERRCVLGVIDGKAYKDIGNPKAVDNALQRAKRKLRAA